MAIRTWEAEETNAETDVKNPEEVVEVSVLLTSEHEHNKFFTDAAAFMASALRKVENARGTNSGNSSRRKTEKSWKGSRQELCRPSPGQASHPND